MLNFRHLRFYKSFRDLMNTMNIELITIANIRGITRTHTSDFSFFDISIVIIGLVVLHANIHASFKVRSFKLFAWRRLEGSSNKLIQIYSQFTFLAKLNVHTILFVRLIFSITVIKTNLKLEWREDLSMILRRIWNDSKRRGSLETLNQHSPRDHRSHA